MNNLIIWLYLYVAKWNEGRRKTQFKPTKNGKKKNMKKETWLIVKKNHLTSKTHIEKKKRREKEKKKETKRSKKIKSNSHMVSIQG